MRFEIYQAPFEQTALGFQAGADYRRVWEGEIAHGWTGSRLRVEEDAVVGWDPPEDATAALQQIFRDFQRVDPETGPWPPEGYTGRSLSIGDVVVLDGWAPFAVEWLGFAVAKGFEGLVPAGENVWVPREKSGERRPDRLE